MASANLRKELECSVCLEYYTDPVTLKCGHNFCRECIDRALDNQQVSAGYSCPECKRSFKKRPGLQSNLKLKNIMENFLSTQPDQEESGVFCTYCIHAPVPAMKSCLHCEASLCDNHLRVHKKSPEHVLCDPTTSLESRKCSVHKELLKYYCIEDSACVCVSCSVIGEHRGHHVEVLDEAAEMKKNTLRHTLQKLMTHREKTEQRVRSLEERRRKVHGKAAGETERANVLFRDLRRQLEDLEKRVLLMISRQTLRVLSSLSDQIQEMETKKNEMSREIEEIEDMCNMADPLTFLRQPNRGDFCDTEDGDEDRERPDRLPHDGDIDMAGISDTLYTGLSDIMSGVNVQGGLGLHVYTHFSPPKKTRITPEVSQPTHQSTSTTQHSHPQARERIGGAQQTSGFTGLSLDVSTAGNDLEISEDRRTASWSSHQNRPETSARFQYPQVLSIQSFSSGRHYWEMDIGGAECWRVGMCYRSIDRRGWPQSGIGYNKKSWCLETLWKNQCFVRHEIGTQLPGKVSSNRVRMDLDFEAGKISFYDLCDPKQHLHTFTTTFTEPLHVGLYVLDGCVRITGGNRI